MNKFFFFLSVFLFLSISTAQILAEPYAPLVKLNAEGKQMMTLQGMTEADRLKDVPDRSEVEIPPYPEAVLTSAIPPMMEGAYPAVNLVSSDSPEKIRAWYREKLQGWTWDDTFSMFHEGEGKLSFAEMYSTQTVSIMEVAKESLDLMFTDFPQAKTRIQIVYKPQ